MEQSIKHYWVISQDWCHCHQRQKNNYTFSIRETNTGAIAQQIFEHQKMRLSARKSVHLVNMNANIINIIKWCITCLEHQQTQPKEKTIPYEVSCKLVEMVDTGMLFLVKHKTVVCTVDYYSEFPIVKSDCLAVDDLVKVFKVIFGEFGLPRKIIFDVGMNVTSHTFRKFRRQMDIEQAITSSYHHQSNGQVKACIK